MIVESIRFKGYRKFEEAQFSFKPGINLIMGLNGSGKSTILDAIGYAIYGEPISGTNLRDNLHYGLRGRSNLATVSLTMSNSKKLEISREIRLSNSIANQKTIFNGKEISVTDLSKIDKNLPSKDVFYELMFIDNLRQDLADLNQQRFRQILSAYRLQWNPQMVLDNMKSFSIYLKSKQSLLNDMVSKSEKQLAEISITDKKIAELEEEQSKLDGELEVKQATLRRLEDMKIAEEVKERERAKSIADIENELKQIDRFEQKIRFLFSDDKFKKLFEDKYMNDFYGEYQSRSNLFLNQTQDFKKFIDQIIAYQKDAQDNLSEKRMKLSYQLDEERKNIVVHISRLERISHDLALTSTFLREQEKTKLLLESYTLDLENYKKENLISESLRNLAVTAMDSTISITLKRIAERVNRYLGKIDVGIDLKITEDQVMAKFKNSDVETDFDVLSAGEKGFLNMLIRIGTLEELGQNNLLILEDPIICFDEKRIKKFLNLLSELRNNFTQIVIATTRKDIYFSNINEVINLIELD